MNTFKKIILPVLLTGIWVNISETIRWEFLVKRYWIEHYESLSLFFPTELMNNITWVIWGFLFAVVIFILSKKFSLVQATLLSWFVVFVLLWIVLWNVGILPKGMLWYVAPLSLLETFVGTLICKLFIGTKRLN